MTQYGEKERKALLTFSNIAMTPMVVFTKSSYSCTPLAMPCNILVGIFTIPWFVVMCIPAFTVASFVYKSPKWPLTIQEYNKLNRANGLKQSESHILNQNKGTLKIDTLVTQNEKTYLA